MNLLCVRWSLAYSLRLLSWKRWWLLRGLNVEHPIIHRWVVRFAPQLLERFFRRKRARRQAPAPIKGPRGSHRAAHLCYLALSASHWVISSISWT